MRKAFWLSVLSFLALVALLTFDWWRPTTVSRVLNEAQISALPAGARDIQVSGGKQGFGTNYRVSFQAAPETIRIWLAQNSAVSSETGGYVIEKEGEGPVGTTRVTVTKGGEVVLYYTASL
jgi:hypothetical protein